MAHPVSMDCIVGDLIVRMGLTLRKMIRYDDFTSVLTVLKPFTRHPVS